MPTRDTHASSRALANSRRSDDSRHATVKPKGHRAEADVVASIERTLAFLSNADTSGPAVAMPLAAWCPRAASAAGSCDASVDDVRQQGGDTSAAKEDSRHHGFRAGSADVAACCSAASVDACEEADPSTQLAAPTAAATKEQGQATGSSVEHLHLAGEDSNIPTKLQPQQGSNGNSIGSPSSNHFVAAYKRRLAKQQPWVTSLDLGGLVTITDAAVCLLADTCHPITSLDLRGCSALTLDCVATIRFRLRLQHFVPPPCAGRPPFS